MKPDDVKALIANSGNIHETRVGTRTSRMGEEEHIGIHDDNRMLNVLNIGPIGFGKTQLMVHAALQDIAKGHGVGITTPKGDAIQQILQKMPDDRLDDIIYINPNQDPVTKINVLQPHITPDMTRAQMENQKEIIVSDLIDLFRRYSKEWGDRFGQFLETLLRAHLDLNIQYDENNTLVDVYNCVVNDEALRDLIDRTDNEYLRNQLIRIKEDMSSYEMEPLQRRLNDFVQNDTVMRVINASESSVDFREVVNEGKILLVEVQKGDVGKTAAELVGSLVLTQVWAAAQSRIAMPEAERRPFYMFIDEVHNFAGEGSNFSKILAEAREYRLGLWLASQYLNQLEPDMRRAVTNNCRTKIFFNPSGSEDLSRIAGMLQGVEKHHLTALGKYRAAMQQPSEEEYRGAVTFDTYPPYDGNRGEQALQGIKREATVGDHDEQAAAVKDVLDLGPANNAGEYRHAEMLTKAKQYLEQRPEVVQVNLLYQDPGEERPDGEIIKQNGTVANLEAEVATLESPARVLKNFKRAADQDRKCVFVTEEKLAGRLENIITDPVNRQGDEHKDGEGTFDYYRADGEPFTVIDGLEDAEYRLLVKTTNGKIRDHAKGSEDECPKLDEFTPDELEAECMYRDNNGHCSLLDAECVLGYTQREGTA